MTQTASRRRLRAAPALAAAATLALGATAVLHADAQVSPTAPSDPLVFVSLAPDRILDTRTGDKVGANETIPLDIRGRTLSYGETIPEAAQAVMVNATITEASEPTFVTLFPSGQPRPESSTLNAVFGSDSSGLGSENVPNMVTVKVGGDGNVSIYNLAGETHVVADIAGYYIPASSAGGGPGGGGPVTGGLPEPVGVGIDPVDIVDETPLDTADTPAVIGTFTAPVAGDYILNGAVDAQLVPDTIPVVGALADVECYWDTATPVTFGESLRAGVDLDPVTPGDEVPGIGRAAFAADGQALDLAAGDEVDFLCQATDLIGSTVNVKTVLSGILVDAA